MSTNPDCNADSRWLASTTRNWMRSGSPKMRARDLAGDVDVEALQLAGRRVSKTEQIRVLVDTDDEPAALGDRRHRRTRWHGARRGQRTRAQTGLAIAVWISHDRRGSDSLRTGRPRLDRCDGHRRRRCRGTASGGGEGKCEQRQHNPRSHRNSLSRGHKPTTAATAATIISTSVPVGLHASWAPAAATRSRRVARVCSISLRKLLSTAANCAAEAPGSGPIACATAAG